MNKVVFAREEAIALENALEINGGDKGSVVHWHAQNLWDGKRKILNDLDLDTICRALYVGYEIESSPEEQLKQYYHSVVNDYHAAGQKSGILNTLQLLNINIPGVNC